MPLSIWEKESFYFQSDVLLVGAGLTGLLSAIFLKQKSPSSIVRIIEKGIYPNGASVKNAGFACFGSVSEILDDLESEGEDKAYSRVIKRYKGLELLQKVISPSLFDWQTNGAYEIFTAPEKDLQSKCFDAIDSINSQLKPSFGPELFVKNSTNFSMSCLPESIFTAKEASINTGKLIKSLLSKARELGVEINLGTELLDYQKSGDQWIITSTQGSFKTQKLVFATNGFSKQYLDLNIEPGRGQVLLTSPIPSLKLLGNYHLHKGYFYFRNFNGRVLLGGGRHLERERENTLDQNTTESMQEVLENLLKNTILPNVGFKISERWAGTMAFGPNNEKEIINKDMGNGLFVTARFGGMGLALSSYEAEIMALKILSA